MSLIDLCLLLLVAGICGSLGQAISGYSRGGCLVSIALGFIGALLGLWLSRLMGLPELLAINFIRPAFRSFGQLSVRRSSWPSLACSNGAGHLSNRGVILEELS